MKQLTFVALLLFTSAIGLLPAQNADPAPNQNHVSPDGRVEAQVDYPPNLWMKNIGSRIDGAGMCVFTSAEMAAIWCGHDQMRGFRDWCAQHYPGGGEPGKLARLIDAFCKHKNIPVPPYVQYEGDRMDLAAAALRNNQMVCSTLYYSKRYGNGRIYHMVNLAHWSDSWGAIADNNFLPYEWDSVSGMEPRLKLSGRVWFFVWLRHGPPPPPK